MPPKKTRKGRVLGTFWLMKSPVTWTAALGLGRGHWGLEGSAAEDPEGQATEASHGTSEGANGQWRGGPQPGGGRCMKMNGIKKSVPRGPMHILGGGVRWGKGCGSGENGGNTVLRRVSSQWSVPQGVGAGSCLPVPRKSRRIEMNVMLRMMAQSKVFFTLHVPQVFDC